MMTADQIIYFINHIADLDNGEKSLRLWKLFWIIEFPLIIGVFHILQLPKFFRGSRKKLIFIGVSLFWWSLLLPSVITLYSLIYIENYNNLLYMIGLYIFIAIFYIWGIEEYFPRYRYATDADYEAARKFIDGSLINKEYPNKTRLYAIAIWIVVSAILICVSGAIAAILFFNKLSYFVPMTIFCIGGYMFFIHLALVRWWVKCPNCHRPIYNIKYNKEGKNDNIYFVKVAWSVLTKKKCECITCHAQYYVK